MKELKQRSTCPVSTSLDVLGDKWTMLILRDMVRCTIDIESTILYSVRIPANYGSCRSVSKLLTVQAWTYQNKCGWSRYREHSLYRCHSRELCPVRFHLGQVQAEKPGDHHMDRLLL